MDDRYPKSEGGLWPNREKKTEKHPDMKGFISVTGDQLRKLIEMGKAGLEPRIQLAGWSRESKAGSPYMYVEAEIYVPKEAAPETPPPMPDIPF